MLPQIGSRLHLPILQIFCHLSLECLLYLQAQLSANIRMPDFCLSLLLTRLSRFQFLRLISTIQGSKMFTVLRQISIVIALATVVRGSVTSVSGTFEIISPAPNAIFVAGQILPVIYSLSNDIVVSKCKCALMWMLARCSHAYRNS